MVTQEKEQEAPHEKEKGALAQGFPTWNYLFLFWIHFLFFTMLLFWLFMIHTNSL